ncbi:peptidylprolyl isomerase [Peptococcus simiae]|uniref:peptidylprolyl isomerase n=1 Tax=Peptococcus simiae TaxID=1643805 RepID=UPI0039806DD1
MKLKKPLALLMATVMAVGVLTGCGSEANSGKEAIKVNDTALKTGYLDGRIDQMLTINQIKDDDAMADYYKAQIIEGLVSTELIRQEADRRGIEITDKDIENLRKKSIKSYGSEDNFKAAMEKYNINDEQFDDMLREQLRYEKLTDQLKKDVKVDAQAYYNENQDQFNVDEQVKASHILVKDENKAKDLIKQLNEGGDFAKLAKENSEDKGNAEKGGELGYFTKDKMVAEFAEAAFAMNPGDVSAEPVKTQYGYHIIKVEDKKAPHLQSFDEVKEELTKQLEESEVKTKLQDLITKLKADAKIDYLDDNYNPEKLMKKAQEQMQKQQAAAASQQNAEGSATAGKDQATDTSKDK